MFLFPDPDPDSVYGVPFPDPDPDSVPGVPFPDPGVPFPDPDPDSVPGVPPMFSSFRFGFTIASSDGWFLPGPQSSCRYQVGTVGY